MTMFNGSFVKVCGYLFVLLTTVGGIRLESPQPTKSHLAGLAKPKTMKLVREFKKNKLQDISTDGRLLLFYQSSTRLLSWHIPLGGGPAKQDQVPIGDDVLRVVELQSGRETAHISTKFFPASVHFVPGTYKVFYSEPTTDIGTRYIYKLWDPISGEVLKPNVTAVYSVVLRDQQRAYGLDFDRPVGSGDRLIEINLQNWTRVLLGPVDPANDQTKIRSKLVVSPDKRFLIYTLDSRPQAIAWDIEKREVAWILNTSPYYVGRRVAYTPDGKLLIISAGYEDDHLLVYDTASYQLVRRLEVPGATAIAISPDSKIVAVAYTETKEQRVFFGATQRGVIVLYDITTGKELARASHPWVKLTHNDPFVAKLDHLAFTPDGKYLMSGIYDTRQWEVQLSSDEAK
jgi:hypothetical protein